jgi:hypothetical protein
MVQGQKPYSRPDPMLYHKFIDFYQESYNVGVKNLAPIIQFYYNYTKLGRILVGPNFTKFLDSSLITSFL